jgi:hypothetical protein
MNQLRHRLQIKANQLFEIIIDWTSVNGFQLLSALVPVDGRAVPVLQWVVKKWKFRRSQNTFEEQFIESLRRCVPRWKMRLKMVEGRHSSRSKSLN